MSTAAVADTPSSEAARRMTGWRWAALGVGCAYIVLLFAVWPYQHWTFEQRGSVLEGWVRVLFATEHSDWRFCLVVPLLSGWLAYRERATLARLPLQGSWWGVAVLLFGALSYWAGFKVDTGYLGFAALQISVAGLILLLAGVPWMRALFLPWVFLVFAWPFFPLDTLLAAHLKLPTAQVAGKILSLTGVELVREGSTLVSAANPAAGLVQGQQFRLDVADDCSGMRSLYALITIAVLYAIVSLRGVWPRLLLAFSAIPLAVVGNVVRLLLLAYGSLWFGQDFAVGKLVDDREETSAFHLLAGFLVFAVALAGMFGLVTWLESRGGKKRKAVRAAGKQSSAVATSTASLSLKYATALSLACVTIFLCWVSPSGATLADPGIELKLPTLVGNYPSTEMTMSLKERSVFDPGVVLVRRQYLTEDRSILATVVLSGTVKKTLHTPEICLPDSGWNVARSEDVTVTLANGKKINASLMHIFREARANDGRVVRLRALHLYWYHGSHGVSTADYDTHNVISYRDAIFRGLNHRWCQVSFYTMLPVSLSGLENMDEEMAARDELIRFAGQIGSMIVKE
jgi:exosortase